MQVEPQNDFPAENPSNLVTKDETYHAFELWLTPDAWPYLPEVTAGRAGMFFAITGVPPAEKKFDEIIK